jgi:hypothetical protein
MLTLLRPYSALAASMLPRWPRGPELAVSPGQRISPIPKHLGRVRSDAMADDEQGRGLPLLTAVTDLYRGGLGIVEDPHASGKTVYLAVVLSTTPVAAL